MMPETHAMFVESEVTMAYVVPKKTGLALLAPQPHCFLLVSFHRKRKEGLEVENKLGMAKVSTLLTSRFSGARKPLD